MQKSEAAALSKTLNDLGITNKTELRIPLYPDSPYLMKVDGKIWTEYFDLVNFIHGFRYAVSVFKKFN